MRSVNTTLLTLLPKGSAATTIKDYRPIACCTVLYKIISKLMTSRMSCVMSYLVNEEQTAFVPGRFIHDNTILAQELIRGYGRKRLSSRCMIKMDLQKAYDSIHWGFVEQLLRGFGFPDKFVGWIMCCMSTVSYYISLNGALLEPFAGKKGLRQGDPISPYLFVLCMEYLSRLMHTVHKNPSFSYHPRCSRLKITHLTFADDILFFSKGTLESITTLLDYFEVFSQTSRLIANKRKSEIYYAGVSLENRAIISRQVQLQEGTLSFRYLAVPLNAKRLSISQYQPLLEKMVSKVQHWSARLLSYGG